MTRIAKSKWPGKPLAHPSVFKHSSPAKSGVQGYLSGFPNKRLEGMEDPYLPGPRPEGEGKKKKNKRGKKKEPKPLVHDSVWRPVYSEKSSVVRSLLRRFY